MIDKPATEAAIMIEEAKKRKMVAAAPEWLKGREERGEELPSMEIHRRHDDFYDGDYDEEEEEKKIRSK